MTVMTCTPAPLPFAPPGLVPAFARLRALVARLPARAVLVVVWLVIAASAVAYADEKLQDWIPGVLAIPEDAEVVTNRAIGSSIRLLSITTGADIDALFTDWKESLSSNGYTVAQGAEDLLEQSIEFTGPDIFNAKIIAAPGAEDGRSIIEFDATLN